MTRIASSALILVALASISCGAQPPLAQDHDQDHGDRRVAPLINGTPSDADPAVATILRGAEPVCTGSLIDAQVVLTAAHCLRYGPTAVRFEGGNLGAPLTVDVATVASHPEYDRRTQRFDMAVLALASAPPAIDPLPVARATELDLQPGSPLRVVGFGDAGDQVSGWRKRQGQAQIKELDADSIVLEGETRPCNGDSGGPALARIEDREYLAAVISRGTVDCAENSVLSRVDSQFDGFISAFLRLAQSTSLPDRARCLRDGNCASGRCLTAVDSRSFATCAGPCAADVDCGRSFTCDGALGLCRGAASLPGALATSCQTDGQCDSVICAGVGGGGGGTGTGSKGQPRTCVRSCAPDRPDDCDATSTCLATEDSPVPFACIPKTIKPSVRIAACAVGAAGPGAGAGTPDLAPSPPLGGVFVVAALAAAGLILARRLRRHRRRPWWRP